MGNMWTKLSWTSLGYSAPEASLKRRAFCSELDVLDVYWIPIFIFSLCTKPLTSILFTPFHRHQGDSNYETHQPQIFMCTMIYPGGCFPFAVTSYWSLCLVSFSQQSLHGTPIYPSQIIWKWFPSSIPLCPMGMCCQSNLPSVELDPHLYMAQNFQLCNFL